MNKSDFLNYITIGAITLGASTLSPPIITPQSSIAFAEENLADKVKEVYGRILNLRSEFGEVKNPKECPEINFYQKKENLNGVHVNAYISDPNNQFEYVVSLNMKNDPKEGRLIDGMNVKIVHKTAQVSTTFLDDYANGKITAVVQKKGEKGEWNKIPVDSDNSKMYQTSIDSILSLVRK